MAKSGTVARGNIPSDFGPYSVQFGQVSLRRFLAVATDLVRLERLSIPRQPGPRWSLGLNHLRPRFQYAFRLRRCEP
jgi:hypothetical protein